jgi:hypothetical protein
VGAEVVRGENKQPCPVRALAWSPAGCTAAGGCLLATVTSDNVVRVCVCLVVLCCCAS